MEEPQSFEDEKWRKKRKNERGRVIYTAKVRKMRGWPVKGRRMMDGSMAKIRRDDEIAVKRLKAMTAKAEMEFAVEVEILGRVRHKNLLGLRGFYAGGDERLIVYDYMPNHSLITHLHGQLAAECLLDWPRRMMIAIGSAEGIAQQCATRLRIPSQSSRFRVRQTDPEGVTHLTTRVKGTLGYLAPEYAMLGKVSDSCDVFSFGILLLEIISARKPLEKLAGGVKRDIVQWATPYVHKGAFDHIADPRLKGDFDMEELKRVIMITMKCTDTNPENRPSMLEVVSWLKGGTGSRRKEMRIVKNDEYDDEDEDEDYADEDETDYEVFGTEDYGTRGRKKF
ncbi:hypothetical protein DH2020_010038 [Rehmannia glutinosa]|uniref:Protein kinase domain-containing protein n=1 Tax=Rehmannia glutinosa TaxID=99300 RepID=A0ABR0XA61_REHGL